MGDGGHQGDAVLALVVAMGFVSVRYSRQTLQPSRAATRGATKPHMTVDPSGRRPWQRGGLAPNRPRQTEMSYKGQRRHERVPLTASCGKSAGLICTEQRAPPPVLQLGKCYSKKKKRSRNATHLEQGVPAIQPEGWLATVAGGKSTQARAGAVTRNDVHDRFGPPAGPGSRSALSCGALRSTRVQSFIWRPASRDWTRGS